MLFLQKATNLVSETPMNRKNAWFKIMSTDIYHLWKNLNNLVILSELRLPTKTQTAYLLNVCSKAYPVLVYV